MKLEPLKLIPVLSAFKDDDSEPISFLPEKGYVYSFPSNLSHRPNEAPNSTNRRIVGVANIKFIYG